MNQSSSESELHLNSRFHILWPCGPVVLWTIPVFNKIQSNDRYKMVIIVKYLQRKEENKDCTCNHGKWEVLSFLNLSFVLIKGDISSFIFASFFCLWLTSANNAASGKTALWTSNKFLFVLSWFGRNKIDVLFAGYQSEFTFRLL